MSDPRRSDPAGVSGDVRAATSLASLPARPDMPEPCRLCPVCSCHAWCRVAEPVPCELLTAVGGGGRD